jgi:hypothetical protein
VVKRDVPVDGDGQERLARQVTFARQNRFCGRRSLESRPEADFGA